MINETQNERKKQMKATYSINDNKIRIYPSERLSTEDFELVKKAGYIWAPLQKIFVAPAWNPRREDVALTLCGTIEDEDTTLEERAELRAERFTDYSEKRLEEAETLRDRISEKISDGIVSSNRYDKAEKQKNQLEAQIQKSVNLWETSKYWLKRAEGSKKHAQYKEKPDVRARRIKTLEAENRKFKNEFTPNPLNQKPISDTNPKGETKFYVWCGKGRGGSWVNMEDIPTLEKYYSRYIKHNENRIAYEKAMLEDQGKSDLLKPKDKPKQLPLCNYKSTDGFTIESLYHKGEYEKIDQIEMLKEDFSMIRPEYKGTRTIENSHRIRIAIQKGKRVAVFLTDSKITEKPEAIEAKPETGKIYPHMCKRANTQPKPENKFDEMKNILKNGITIAVSEDLFVTPKTLVEEMIELAELEPGMTVLEPEAGTGNIVREIPKNCEITAVEVNASLCEILKKETNNVKNQDFLTCGEELGKFDRIIMNPPFSNAGDITHIKHAMKFLKPDGILVAISSGGPRQEVALKPLCRDWKKLEAGTFKESGTNVNTVLLVIEQ